MKKPGKVSLRKTIEETGGVVSDIASHFNVTRQTIYNWLEHYELRDKVVEARQNMRAVAQDVIYARLVTGDDAQSFDAAKFVMLHLRDDGELLALSPETLLLLRQMGMDTSAVVASFEAMVRQAAVNVPTPNPSPTHQGGES